MGATKESEDRIRKNNAGEEWNEPEAALRQKYGEGEVHTCPDEPQDLDYNKCLSSPP